MRDMSLLALLVCALALGETGEANALNNQKILARLTSHLPRGTGAMVVEGDAYGVAFEDGDVVLRPPAGADRDVLRFPVPAAFAAARGSVLPEDWQCPNCPRQQLSQVVGFAPVSPSGEAPDAEPDNLSAVEFLLDTVPVLLSPDRLQILPVAAFDGTNYLVVWEDWRGDGDIYCSRVTADGALLDPGGIPVCAVPGYQVAPSVTFNGSDFVVVWEDWRRTYCSDIYGARVSTSGAVLDPSGRPVCTARNDQWSPRISAAGGQCLVVWDDYRSGSGIDVYASRLGSGFSVVDPAGIAVAATGQNDAGAQVAAGSGGWLVTWARWWSILDSSDVYAARVTADGTVLDYSGFAVTTATGIQYGPDASYDGSNYLVAWSDHRNDLARVYACRLSGSGSRLDPSDIAVSPGSGDEWATGVGHNGTDFVVTWDLLSSDQQDVRAGRVSGSGTVLDPSGIAVCSATDDQLMSSLDAEGTNSLVVWTDMRTPNQAFVYGARLSGSGAVLDPDGKALNTMTNPQTAARVAASGTGYFAVWEDARSGNSDIYGCRYRSDGTLLDPVPLAVATGDQEQVQPQVAFDGSNYLVVWADYGGSNPPDIRACRVSAAGTVLDPSGIGIAAEQNEQTAPAVAFDGTNYLVVWQDDRIGNNWDDIYACRVTTDGVIKDTGYIPVSTTINWQVAPRVAWGGGDYLVVWEDHRPGVRGDIYGCRIRPDGVVVDTFGLAISRHDAAQSVPDVASNGHGFMVVWQDARDGRSAVYCARVSDWVLDPSGRRILGAWHNQTSPSICWDGSQYMVAWQSSREASSSIMAACVSNAGTLAGLYWVGMQTCAEIEPDLAGTGGEVSVVYPGWTGSIDGRAYNQFRIWAARCIENVPDATPGWSRLPDVPAIWRKVKDGGGLTALDDKVYVVVGYKTFEFHEYDIASRSWRRLPDIPAGLSGKPVKKGACITNDGYSVYLLKGNRTYEFYRYDPLIETWFELPQPVLIKKIKGGSMAFDGERSVYMIPGDRIREWKVFDVFDEAWRTPDPESLPTKKWKRGSCITAAGDKLYGLRRGGRTNEFYELNIRLPGQTWNQLADLPLYNSHGKRKKVKDGAGVAWDGNVLYALKGGKTNEFYAYDPATDEWTTLLEVGQPNGVPTKPVKYGGGLSYSPYAGGFFALVGNKTNDFWCYVPGAEPVGGGVQSAGIVPREQLRLTLAPNPTSGRAVIRWHGPVSGSVRADFYDASGRLAFRAPVEQGCCELPANTLEPGIYLVRVHDEGQTSEAKIVIAK